MQEESGSGSRPKAAAWVERQGIYELATEYFGTTESQVS